MYLQYNNESLAKKEKDNLLLPTVHSPFELT